MNLRVETNVGKITLHTMFLTVSSDAFRLYSKSGRNVILPFHYVMVQREFRQGLDASVKLFEM